MIEYLKKLFKPMSIKIGDIDIGQQTIDNEFSEKFITKLIEWMFNNNPQLRHPTPEEIGNMKREVIRELQNKYPNSGIRSTE